MSLSVGAIVRVVKQPNDLYVHIKGDVGFIDEMLEGGTHARIVTLKLDGEMGGTGPVMLDCLEPELAPEWAEAKRIHDENKAYQVAILLARSDRIKTRIQELAQEYGLTPEKVDEIHLRVEKIHSRDGWPEDHA
jgi:hypothetical protein